MFFSLAALFRGSPHRPRPEVPAGRPRRDLSRGFAAVALLAVVAMAGPAHAQATVGAVSSTGAPSADTTTVTISGHSVFGSNRYLAVAISGDSTASNNSFQVLSVVWKPTPAISEALARQGAYPATAEAHRTRAELWGSSSVTAGTGSIVITLANPADVVAKAITVFNVQQGQTPTFTGSDLHGGSTSATVTGTDGLDIVFSTITVEKNAVSRISPDAGQLWNEVNSDGDVTGGGSAKTGSVGSTTVTWNGTLASDKGGLLVMAFQGITGPTAVRLESFQAAQYANGVTFHWRTGWETQNLGFNLYREVGGERIKLNKTLIAGGALLSRGPLSGGSTYSWQDPGSPAGAYWLQDIDINGKRTWHGPFKPYLRSTPLPVVNSATLGDAAAITGQSRTVRTSARNAAKRAAQISQSKLAGIPALKIEVAEEGWYRIGSEQLVAAGLKLGMPSQLINVFVEGREIPILIADGGDGRLNQGDSVHFFGVGVDTPYTDRRVYWLTAGLGSGLRIPVTSGGVGGTTPTSFLTTIELRERSFYLQSLDNGEEDNYFGAPVFGSGVDQVLNVRHLAPAAAASTTLRVTLQGGTSIPGTTPDHNVLVRLNGIDVGSVVFDGRVLGSGTFAISPALLREGDNTVTLIPQAGALDITLVDRIQLTYPRAFVADGGSLAFSAQGGQRVTVEGLPGPEALIVDVTNPDAPRVLSSRAQQSADGLQVTVVVPGGKDLELLAVSAEGFCVPAGFKANRPSSLLRTTAGASFLIIGPGEFLPTLKPLQALRRSQGLPTALIDVEDIYDEFSYGEKTPMALKAFLAAARSGARRDGAGPNYVLLAGDASSDPRDFLGKGQQDLVPSKLVGTQFMETASDDWFVDFNGDGLPEMAIGRLPADSQAELALMVRKIVAYDQAGAIGGALLVSDRNDGFNFEAASDAVASLLPGSAADKLYRSSAANPTADLVTALNRGYALVNFAGHGGNQVWRGLLTSDDVNNLTNSQRLSFVVAMTCMNGAFQTPQQPCLAEALLNAPRGGAVAVWASTSTCEPQAQSAMNKELIRTLFSSAPTLSRRMTIGEAVMRAKGATVDPDVRRTWVFFGDPTTRMH